MDKKTYNTRMAVASLILCLIGLIFILVSVFNAGATSTLLIVGFVFLTLGNMLNLVRIQRNQKGK